MNRWGMAIVSLLLVACSAGERGAEQSVESGCAQGNKRMFNLERFALTGDRRPEGQFTLFVRDWGASRVYIDEGSPSVRYIANGDDAYLVREDGSVTGPMENDPFFKVPRGIFARVSAPCAAPDPISIVRYIANDPTYIEVGRASVDKVGQAEIAGHKCDLFEFDRYGRVGIVADQPVRYCITSDGVPLSADRGAPMMATELRPDDGGPDEAFVFDVSAAIPAPPYDPDARRQFIDSVFSTDRRAREECNKLLEPHLRSPQGVAISFEPSKIQASRIGGEWVLTYADGAFGDSVSANARCFFDPTAKTITKLELNSLDLGIASVPY